ncbi:MAG: class I SAM-dependent methyltransferase [Rectinemataceae bacterium]
MIKIIKYKVIMPPISGLRKARFTEAWVDSRDRGEKESIEVATENAGVKSRKGYKGISMEGFIATWYARTTRSRIEEQRAIALDIAARVPQGGRVLEVAPGPGYLSIELAKLGTCKGSGLDISRTFVDIEKRNAEEAGVRIDFRHGDATEMPFDDDTFDFAVCVAAFKNFTQPRRVIDEFHRVLRLGGTALIFDLRRDASAEGIAAEIDGMKLSPVNAFLTRAAFRYFLLRNAYTQAEIETLVARTKFERCAVKCNNIGMEITLVK